MRALIVLASVLAIACSDPIAPSRERVAFAVQLYGHISAQPIVGEPVLLLWDDGGLPTPLGLDGQRSNAAGVVRWQVQPGRAYVVIVRGVPHFQGVIVVNDSQWLLSLPE